MFNIIPWGRSNNLNVKRERNPFTALQSEINRTFDDFFNNGFEKSLIPAKWMSNELMIPTVDALESDKGFKVEVELPGMDEKDIEVTINDNYLIVKGDKKEAKEDEGENYTCRERYYGSCQRTIMLPETADVDNAKAKFKKGVLSVEIPKKEEAIKPSKKLEINVST